MSLEPPLNIMATKPPNCDYEQRAYIKIRSLLGDTNTQIQIDLKKVYGDNTLSDSTIRRWSLLFREGRQSVDDDPRTGRKTPPVVARPNRFAAKVMYSIFFDGYGPVSDGCSQRAEHYR